MSIYPLRIVKTGACVTLQRPVDARISDKPIVSGVQPNDWKSIKAAMEYVGATRREQKIVRERFNRDGKIAG